MKFDRERIDLIVGKVWRVLNDNRMLSIKDIQEKTNESKEDILLSIGWLIKEDKIDYEGKRSLKLFLKN